MITQAFTVSDGKKRTIEGKVFGDELRVYRVYGDVSDREALAEVAQEAALHFGVDKVRMPL